MIIEIERKKTTPFSNLVKFAYRRQGTKFPLFRYPRWSNEN